MVQMVAVSRQARLPSAAREPTAREALPVSQLAHTSKRWVVSRGEAVVGREVLLRGSSANRVRQRPNSPRGRLT